MFCDLADSTKLSSSSTPEDLREVVRAYQVTATGGMPLLVVFRGK
jgi:class 3 adenylate cyclase